MFSKVSFFNLATHLITIFYLFLNREGRWGTTDDFATSSLHFFLFSTALLDWANSKPVHCLMLSSDLFLCLLCLISLHCSPIQFSFAFFMHLLHNNIDRGMKKTKENWMGEQ